MAPIGQIKLSEDFAKKLHSKNLLKGKVYKQLAITRHDLKKKYVDAKANGEENALSDFLSAMGHNLASSSLQGRVDVYSDRVVGKKHNIVI